MDTPSTFDNTSLLRHLTAQRPDSPAAWWRRPCFATERVAVSGDLDTFAHARGVEQLHTWERMGITDIIDVRDEWNDEDFVALHAPALDYHHFGTDDMGNGQPLHWFDRGAAAACAALQDPQRKIMVHCHMGVNRGPSMAFAVLLAGGAEPVAALTAIRECRPIAALIYAQDALAWWHQRSGADPERARHETAAVAAWMNAHAVDVSWIVSRIHRAGSAA